jgi:hypothetical protein
MIMSRSFSKNKKPKAFGIRRKGSMPAMPLGVTQKSNKAAKSKASPKKTVGGKNADVGEKKVEEYDNLEYISPLPEEPGSAEGKKEEEVKMAPQKISNHLIAKRACEIATSFPSHRPRFHPLLINFMADFCCHTYTYTHTHAHTHTQTTTATTQICTGKHAESI